MGAKGTRTRAAPAGTAQELLEREDELAALEAALAAAKAAEGRLLYIEAHAGIGKSRLLEAASELGVEAGLRVLAGGGSELERSHAFGVVLQLFEPAIARAAVTEREELLGGAAGLARPLLEGEAGFASSAEDQLFARLHGLYWLTSNLAERQPLVLAVDDAHWSDRASLRFLLYLALRLVELPLVLLVSARPDEPGAPKDLLRQLKAHPTSEPLRPAALSRRGVEALVERRMGAAATSFVDACATATGGNPYLLKELLADVADRGIPPTGAGAGEVRALAPDAVLEAALVRLERLPAGAAALARAVAVLDEQASFGRAAELAGLDRDQAAAAADALAGGEILASAAPLAFVHPLLRGAIYTDIPDASRGELHASAARLLDRDGVDAEAIAAQILRATRAGDPWAVGRLRSAAARSLSQGAVESAVGYLERALAEPPPPELRPEVLIELGEAESLLGRAVGLERLEAGLSLTDDRRRRAQVLERMGWALQKQGDLARAAEAFSRGITELRELPDGNELGEELSRLEVAHLGAALSDPNAARQAQARIESLLEGPAAELSLSDRGLLAVAAMSLMFRGEEHERVVSLAERAWDDGRLMDGAGADSPTVWHLVACLSWSDALESAEAVINAMLRSAGSERSPVALALALCARSWSRYWRGELKAAAADAQGAVDAWSGELSMYLPLAAHWLSLAQLELDEVDAAARAVDMENAQERWGDSMMYGPLLAGRGMVAMARGAPERAISLFERAGEAVHGTVFANPAVIPWRSYLALARLHVGERSGAADAAEAELELTRRFGAARPIGIALRSAGVTAGGERGLELLGESVDVLRGSPSRLELARSLVDLGGATRRHGQGVVARAPLREGLGLAQRMGAVVLERRAYDELLASGARPRRRETSGVDSLTPSERRVAELAASGMTNREIAQSVFVTVKAVKFHLHNTYRKLDCDSREQLPALLGQVEASDLGRA